MSQQATILALRQRDVVQYGLEDGINEYEEYQEYIFQYDAQKFFEFLQKQISLLSYETPLDTLEELEFLILEYGIYYSTANSDIYQDVVNSSSEELRMLKNIPNPQTLRKLWIFEQFEYQELVRSIYYCSINATVPDTLFQEIPDIEKLRKLWRSENR
jgi:hypothetical protein